MSARSPTVLGLTATAAGQISRQFTVLDATTVTVQDNGPANDVAAPGTNPAIGFPANADPIAERIGGVVAAGVWWPVSLPNGTDFTSSPALSATAVQNVNLLAASPGAVAAMGLTMAAGSPLTRYENDTAQHVALIDTATAAELGISPARLAEQPAVFVDGIPYTIVGVYRAAQRVVAAESAMLIPEKRRWPTTATPRRASGTRTKPRWSSRPSWARRRWWGSRSPPPSCPGTRGRLVVTTPPNPQTLQSQVSGDLTGLFLILASISLLIGAVGIANTTLVAVLERTEEIGLRRALGARPRHIASQFLAESTALGTLGGLIGTSLGVLDRGRLRRGPELDLGGEPGRDPARAADRQRRRAAGRGVPGAARVANQPARGPAARMTE